MRISPALRMLARLACFLPLAGGLLLIDWIAAQPPFRRAALAKLDAAASVLASGQSVWSNFDIGDLKRAMLSKTGPVDVLVLGSSRVIQIPQAWFGPRRLFNAAVLAGDLDDMVSLFELYRQTGNEPQTVILELNPTLVFEDKKHAARLAPALRRALLRYRVFPLRFFSRPFMLEQLEWDVRVFLRPPVAIVSGSEPGGYLMRPDGSTEWSIADPHATVDQAEAAALRQVHINQLRHWRISSEPERLNLSILRAFLDDLQRRRIQVIALLPPIHPAAYGYYFGQGGYHDEWIRREMAGRGIDIIGSFSPAAVGATRADFFDDVHPRPALLHRMLIQAGIVP
jgi:hypothetical protein